MTLNWVRRYYVNGTFCETEGVAASPVESVQKYLVDTVRPEWERWATLDPSATQSLNEAGFSAETIEQVLRSGIGESSDTALRGDFGEVFATLFLNSKQGMQFPWPTFWDRRTSTASLSGGDLVGLAEDSKGTAFVIGQVKASAENRHPPTVVSHNTSGLIAQLGKLRGKPEVILSHLKWLLTRAEGTAWQQDLFHAFNRLSNEPTDVLVVGVLVRDCTASQSDLQGAHTAFAEIQGPRVRLFGCYLPLGLDECVQLSRPNLN